MNTARRMNTGGQDKPDRCFDDRGSLVDAKKVQEKPSGLTRSTEMERVEVLVPIECVPMLRPFQCPYDCVRQWSGEHLVRHLFNPYPVGIMVNSVIRAIV